MNANSVTFKNFRPRKFNENYKKNPLNDSLPYKCVCPDLGYSVRFALISEAEALFSDPNTGRCLMSYNTEKQQYFIAYRFK